METVALVVPIRPGKPEDWRRFAQELQGPQRSAYEASRRRLGIDRETAWLLDTAQGALAVIRVAATDPTAALARWATSDAAFDRWCRRQVRDLHGLDLAGLGRPGALDLLYDWPAR